MEKVIFQIPTIHCAGCVGNVQRVLTKVPGVLAVEGDPQSKEVTIIRHAGAVADEELAERIAHTGHVVAGIREG